MIVQWCIKGIAGNDKNHSDGIDDNDAQIMANRAGICSNWWRHQGAISPAEIQAKLTPRALDQHVNDYDAVRQETPFISLAAGCVERDVLMRTNRVYPAQRIAQAFATENGQRPGYLFTCWIVLGLAPAVEVAHLGEEVRALNTYRSFSDYQLEGEVTAKVHVPANQIHSVEKWKPVRRGALGDLERAWPTPHVNPAFVDPRAASNIRDLF